MFGPDVYWRLFELHNRALWPFPIIAALTGVACLVLVAMRGRVAVRTAPINWPMRYGAWAFAFEAGLLTLMGVSGCLATPSTSGRATKIAGHGLLALALVLYPFPGLAFGRPWHRPKFSALPPDPTAIACLGMLSLVTAGRWAVLLVASPLLWCGVGAATLLTLGEPQAWVLIAAVTMWASGRAATIGSRA